MATAKREIYARMATQLLNHERAVIAETECPGAMGLYAFLLMQARFAETHGETIAPIAYASWGAPIAYRKRQAAALIKAGLVEEKDGKLLVVKYLDHNDGPEDIRRNKAAASLRQDKRRHPERYASVTRDTSVTSHGLSHDNPSSCSSSSSISYSDLEGRSEEPDPARATPEEQPSRPHNDAPPCAAPTSLVAVPDAMSAPPDWWDAVIATLHASTGVLVSAVPCWLSYAGHRASKGRPAERSDALYWLNQVKVPEERERLRRESRDRERDDRMARERQEQRRGPEMPKQTPEQAQRDAQRFAAQIAARKGAA